MEKSTVKALHNAVNKALETVAREHGFVYRGKRMTYSDCQVSGRMVFIAEGKQVELAEQSEAYAPHGCAYKVGEPVTVQGKVYEIKEFTQRGCAIIIDINTGKEYRLKARAVDQLSKSKVEKDAYSSHRKERVNKLTPEQFKSFEALTCRLSPENLACDGEISKTETNRRYQQCMREWKALEKEAGMKVTQEEIETESFIRTREKK